MKTKTFIVGLTYAHTLESSIETASAVGRCSIPEILGNFIKRVTRRNAIITCGLISALLLATGTRLAHSADIIDDFSSGLADWTVQTTRGNVPVANEVIANPSGDPVIEIAAQGNGAKFADPPWTILTSNSAGAAGDFDIAVSFAGSVGMNGLNSFGLVFGFQDTQNYYIAHLFPGFGGSAFRLEKVVSGVATIVFAGSRTNHNVGFTWNTGDDNALVTPDALRIQRVGNNFDAFVADSSGGGWLSFFQSTWTDNTFPAAPSLVGFGERFDGSIRTTGGRFAVFGSGATGIDAVLASTDLTLALSLVGTAPSLGCVGFESPMNGGHVKVKKNRVLPLKAQLLNEISVPINDLDITALPVIQVIFNVSTPTAEDVTAQALSAGAGTNGNQFEFLDSKWQFNLKTKNYSAAGTYTITMESGDTAEYLVDPTCTGSFVIN